jgi:sorting nexin-1/2
MPPPSAASAKKLQQQGDDDDDDDVDGGEAGGRAGGARPRQPPPVQAALPSPVRSAQHPSVSVEQAARPSFRIAVGDPHKVGDLTSSHIVYSVRTQVCF